MQHRFSYKSVAAGTVALALAATAAVAQAQSAPPQRDPAALGQALFLRCSACHAISADAPQKIGPHLQGIIGRHAGTAEGFAYSDAMTGSQIIWDQEQLDRFIERPAGLVPGTSMAFGGIDNEQQRAALIAYLESLD